MQTLPRWPITAMFVPFPLWWALGVAEMAWIPIAGAMVLLMVRHGAIRIPRGLGLFLLFLLLMAVSVIGIDTPGRLVGFGYRALQYAAVTVAFVYVYNARSRVGVTWLLGVLTAFWSYVVLGGWLGVLAPQFSFRTPFGYLVPASLQGNELVQQMVVRRATQWNPESWFAFEPRPSTPFLYTNGWGNAYSLLLPLVIAYLARIPRDRTFFAVLALIPLSFVPAFLTLNRGMFIGLAVAVVWATLRLVAAGRTGAVAVLATGVLVGLIAAVRFDVWGRLSERLSESSTTEDRASLYGETLARTLESPLLGYGAPRPSSIPGAPSVGTQGHVWTVMFSHGFPALAVFLASLAWLFFATWRWRTTTGLAVNTTVGVLLVEVFYYGVLPVGLMIAFVAAAAVLPGRSDGGRVDSSRPRPSRAATPAPLVSGGR